MHGIELVSPALTRDYSLKSFRAELKTILPKAGVQGTPICLLLEDHQLRSDALIEVATYCSLATHCSLTTYCSLTLTPTPSSYPYPYPLTPNQVLAFLIIASFALLFLDWFYD